MAMCGGGGGGRRVLVVVVVVVVVVGMVSPVHGQTGDRGAFQLYKSCGSSIRLTTLVVNDPMWLRGRREAVTLITSGNTSEPCLLPPDATHQVTVGPHLEIHVGGAAGEEERVCSFPKHAVFQLPRGLLMVSCLSERSQAEAEMLGAEVSSSSTSSPAGPQHRALDLPSTQDTTKDTPTTLGPQNSHELLLALTTLESPTRAGSRVPPSPAQTTANVVLTESSGTGTGAEHLKTTEVVTGTVSFTKPPTVTDDRAMKTTKMSDSAPEHLTGGTTEATDATTSATPGSSSTQETGLAEELTPPAGTQQSDIKRKNISVRELAIMSNVPHSEDQISDEPDDHVIYLAGAGAGVLALVLGVVVVAGVAYHRRRQAKARQKQEDFFISGAYKGSMNSLNNSGSQGAYLNAHVMYSGADPEFVESFELEERILNSAISYSSHDIPKCLKEP